MAKLFDSEGAEVEAFLPDEVQTKVSEAVTAKETEFTTIRTGLESELGEAKRALGERAGEFAQFRKLSDDTIAKLTVAERTIYENGLALQQEREKNATMEKERLENAVSNVIKSKAGANEKLAEKMKEMWSVIGIDATTPEMMETKANMILGALGNTQPDLVASVSSFNGGYMPPKPARQEGQSFADTEEGKKAAKEFGLVLEVPAQK